jgi:hypothetical protein
VKIDSLTATTTIDTASALPGKAIVTYSYLVSGLLTNSTAGRIAPAPDYVLVEPVWSAGSAVCAALPRESNQAFSSNDPGQEGKFCSVAPDGATVSPSVSASSLAIGATVAARAAFGYRVSVDEAAAPAVSAALKAPELWILARNEGDGWQTSCLVRSGAFSVTQSTGATGCHA